MDFGPNEETSDNFVDDDTLNVAENGAETKKEKTRRKMIAENRAILALIEQSNEEGKCWLEQVEACAFTCFLCTSTVETFSRICDHMDNSHPLESVPYEDSVEESHPAVYQCIACPKRFKKKNHLKVCYS